MEKRINPREAEVLSFLFKNEGSTSSEIANKSTTMLSQSTVQTVLRKLLKMKLVEVTGVTYSGNVLSRTFKVTEKAKEALLQDVVASWKNLNDAANLNDLLEAITGKKLRRKMLEMWFLEKKNNRIIEGVFINTGAGISAF